MTLRAVLLAVLACVASLARAQAPEPLQAAQPVHAPPAMQVRQGAAPPAALQVDREAELARENERLRRDNEALRRENAALKADVDSYRVLGGSQVHAFCGEDGTTSRNTAGVSSDCARSGYLCEQVSGLCRTTCQNTGECAVGWVCDTAASQCITPEGG